MAGTPKKPLFSAEIQMMKEKGQDLSQPVFNTAAPEAAPVAQVDGVSNAQLLSAILDLQIFIRKSNQEKAAPVEEPGVRASSDLKNEIRALSRSIQETKSEIRSMQGGTQGGDKVLKASSELDAVVAATEEATNNILEAVENIDELAAKIQINADNEDDRGAADEIMEITIKVIEACNFQDLTGQRITKVVNALNYVEDRINAMIGIWGEEGIAEVDASVADETDEDKTLLNGPAMDGEGIDQNDIDALFD